MVPGYLAYLPWVPYLPYLTYSATIIIPSPSRLLLVGSCILALLAVFLRDHLETLINPHVIMGGDGGFRSVAYFVNWYAD